MTKNVLANVNNAQIEKPGLDSSSQHVVQGPVAEHHLELGRNAEYQAQPQTFWTKPAVYRLPGNPHAYYI